MEGTGWGLDIYICLPVSFMEKNRKLIIIVGYMILIVFALLWFLYPNYVNTDNGYDENYEEIDDENYCIPNERNAEICTKIYQPVCGWSDPEKIQCIKYPCAQTYSNRCLACANENVLYLTAGECPNG